MLKKPNTANRLDKLFKDFQPENTDSLNDNPPETPVVRAEASHPEPLQPQVFGKPFDKSEELPLDNQTDDLDDVYKLISEMPQTLPEVMDRNEPGITKSSTEGQVNLEKQKSSDTISEASAFLQHLRELNRITNGIPGGDSGGSVTKAYETITKTGEPMPKIELPRDPDQIDKLTTTPMADLPLSQGTEPSLPEPAARTSYAQAEGDKKITAENATDFTPKIQPVRDVNRIFNELTKTAPLVQPLEKQEDIAEKPTREAYIAQSLPTSSRSIIGHDTPAQPIQSPPRLDEPRLAPPISSSVPKPVKRHTAALPKLPVVLAKSEDGEASLAMAFQTGDDDWSTLRIFDETSPRSWSEDEQLLVKQVAEQLALALENARLFQETKARGEELLKFRLGIERTDNAVFMTDIDGKIQYVNDGFEKIYGYKPEEAIGKTPRIIKSGLMPAEQYEAFWKSLLNKETITGEIVNRAKDGRLVPVAGTNAPILDDTGDILGFLAVHVDISEQKKTQEVIRRRNDYLAASAEIGRLVTSTLDLNTIFSRSVELIFERFGFYHAAIFIVEETGFNAILKEASGHASEELKSQGHSIPVGSQTIVGMVTSRGQPIVIRDTASDPGYQINPMLPETRSEAAIPLRVGDRIIGVLDIQSNSVNAFPEDEIEVLQTLADQVAVAIDNARSYELSQQAVMEMREIDRLKSQFLANMSHELRTPLNSIIGFSRVILKGIDGPVSDLQQQDLSAIYNSGQHLLGLINDILDLSKIEAGKMELAFDEVNIADLINSVITSVTGLMKDKPIILKRELLPNLPTVRADAIRIRQVMINLLSNAAKFTEEGEITVRAEVASEPGSQSELIVKVTDTGPGISLEDQEKLFQPFSQVDDSPTRKTGGSGLGLSISRQLIQLHGGRIGVKSSPGEGSTFYFTLPLYRTLESPGVLPGSKTIVAIDDDPQVIGLYERYLQPHGYQVIPLTDSSHVIDRIKQVKPFAITLDVMMPGIDGWQVLTDLKADRETRDTPVILCSIVENQQKGFNLGATDYLVKPILEEELVRILDRLNQDGSIREVMIIDDNLNDLGLLGKMLTDDGRYLPILVESTNKGWEMINSGSLPQVIILDIFMPNMDGFEFLEKLKSEKKLSDLPVVVLTSSDLTAEQHLQLQEFGHRLINKSTLDQSELVANIAKAIEHAPAGK